MAKLNITDAAKAADISRTTMYAHIKKGKVSCEEDEEGNKWLDISELERVYGKLNTPNVQQDVQVNNAEQGLTPSETGRIAVMEREIEHLNAQLKTEQERRQQAESREEEIKAEKTRLLGIIEKQTYLLAAPEGREDSTKTGFWKRLFG